jgi:hypothetical protein
VASVTYDCDSSHMFFAGQSTKLTAWGFVPNMRSVRRGLPQNLRMTGHRKNERWPIFKSLNRPSRS